MFGLIFLFIILIILICIVFFILDNSEPLWITIAGVFVFITLLVTLGMIDGKQTSKSKVEEYKVLQANIEYQRLNDFSEFERLQVLKDINKANEQIAKWKTRGERWWDNKWLYHSSTQTIEYLH